MEIADCLQNKDEGRDAEETDVRRTTTKKAMTKQQDEPFWRSKTLEEMTAAEWESICDGCGRCCLHKLEDWDTGQIFFTDVVCRLFDPNTCRCTDYENRHKRVEDCIALTAENVGSLNWLPPTCGYRLLAEGQDLYWWHPLVSGDPETVQQAGVSVRKRVRCETTISEADLEDYLVDWPSSVPKTRRAVAQDRSKRTGATRRRTK